jgi:hypothetical protein
LILVCIDLWMHYQHHKKKKQARQPLYTLDEARAILFKEALEFDNRVDGTSTEWQGYRSTVFNR